MEEMMQARLDEKDFNVLNRMFFKYDDLEFYEKFLMEIRNVDLSNPYIDKIVDNYVYTALLFCEKVREWEFVNDKSWNSSNPLYMKVVGKISLIIYEVMKLDVLINYKSNLINDIKDYKYRNQILKMVLNECNDILNSTFVSDFEQLNKLKDLVNNSNTKIISSESISYIHLCTRNSEIMKKTLSKFLLDSVEEMKLNFKNEKEMFTESRKVVLKAGQSDRRKRRAKADRRKKIVSLWLSASLFLGLGGAGTVLCKGINTTYNTKEVVYNVDDENNLSLLRESSDYKRKAKLTEQVLYKKYGERRLIKDLFGNYSEVSVTTSDLTDTYNGEDVIYPSTGVFSYSRERAVEGEVYPRSELVITNQDLEDKNLNLGAFCLEIAILYLILTLSGIFTANTIDDNIKSLEKLIKDLNEEGIEEFYKARKMINIALNKVSENYTTMEVCEKILEMTDLSIDEETYKNILKGLGLEFDALHANLKYDMKTIERLEFDRE